MNINSLINIILLKILGVKMVTDDFTHGLLVVNFFLCEIPRGVFFLHSMSVFFDTVWCYKLNIDRKYNR